MRDRYEKDLSDLPSAANYNLSKLYSIENKTKPDLVKEIRKDRIIELSKSMSRFKDKTFYAEKERLMKGNDSVSPDKYDVSNADKITRIRRTFNISFSKADRKLFPKRQKPTSLSPTKYSEHYI